MGGRGDEGRRTPRIVGIKGEGAEVDVGEIQLGVSVGGVVQADAFATEGFADVVGAAFMCEVSAGGNDFDLEMLGIDQRLVVLIQASRTVMVSAVFVRRFQLISVFCFPSLPRHSPTGDGGCPLTPVLWRPGSLAAQAAHFHPALSLSLTPHPAGVLLFLS